MCRFLNNTKSTCTFLLIYIFKLEVKQSNKLYAKRVPGTVTFRSFIISIYLKSSESMFSMMQGLDHYYYLFLITSLKKAKRERNNNHKLNAADMLGIWLLI